jgi:hypothetical protein
MVRARTDKVLVVGGYSLGQSRNDVVELDVPTLTWTTLTTFGAKPAERQGMAAIVHGSRLVMAGGCDYSLQTCYSDLYALDVESLVWTRIDNLE